MLRLDVDSSKENGAALDWLWTIKYLNYIETNIREKAKSDSIRKKLSDAASSRNNFIILNNLMYKKSEHRLPSTTALKT